jgi:hypothetical protein
MKITTLLFLLIIPFMGFAQMNQPSDFKKLGIGIGYNFHPAMSDSIRPIELSLRYRINDRHTLQVYTPVSYKKQVSAMLMIPGKKRSGVLV